MRTTIDINDAILRDLREYAKRRGCSLKAAAEEILLLGLADQSKGNRVSRFQLKPHRLGLKTGFQGVSLNQLYDQLEAEDDMQ